VFVLDADTTKRLQILFRIEMNNGNLSIISFLKVRLSVPDGHICQRLHSQLYKHGNSGQGNVTCSTAAIPFSFCRTLSFLRKGTGTGTEQYCNLHCFRSGSGFAGSVDFLPPGSVNITHGSGFGSGSGSGSGSLCCLLIKVTQC
jgi:hypothetical protein